MKRIFAVLFVASLALAAPAWGGYSDLLPARGGADWDIAVRDAFDAVNADMAAAGTGTATVRIGTYAEMMAFATPYAGLRWEATDTGRSYVYSGSNWIDKTTKQVFDLADYGLDPDSPGSFATLGSSGYKVEVLALADAATQGILGRITLPDSTRTYQVYAFGRMSTSVSSKTVRMRCTLKACQAGELVEASSNDIDASATITTRDDANGVELTSTSWRITPAELHNDNIQVRLGFWRVGGDGADTHTGVLYIYGIYLVAVN